VQQERLTISNSYNTSGISPFEISTSQPAEVVRREALADAVALHLVALVQRTAPPELPMLCW
jgi:hypothetical protein